MADTDAFEYDVFLSHNRADKDWTRMLAARIERETWNGHALKTFYSERDIRPGQSIPQRMQDALTKSRKVALILSPEALASPWVEVEYLSTLYADLSKRREHLIPLMRRECEPPYLVAPLRYIDFRDHANFELAFRELLAVIKNEPLPDGVETLHATSLHTAPIPRTPPYGFVPRYDDQGNDLAARVSQLLKQNCAVALVGLGGVGKTTLAAEIVRAFLPSPAASGGRAGDEGRVVWASADGRADFALTTLLDEAATQLGSADLRTLALEQKTNAVRDLLAESRAMIVLDNFETIAAEQQNAIAAFVNTLSGPALITSRLAVEGADRVGVGAMSPDEARDFLTRLIANSPKRNALTPLIDEIAAIAERNPMVMRWIVGQLELAQRMSDVLDELSHGEGDAATRVFGRSFGLLNADAQAALLSLALCVPSADRAALAFTAGFGDDIKRLNAALKPLAGLLPVERDEKSERLSVVGLTRRFTSAQLDKDSNAAEYRKRFVDYFVRYREVHAETTPEDFNALEAERENLLAAMDTAFAKQDIESVMRNAKVLASPARGMLVLRGYWHEAIRRCEQGLESARKSQIQAQVALFARMTAVMYQRLGDKATARDLLTESITASREISDQHGIARTLHQLGMLADEQGNVLEAENYYAQGLEIDKKLDDELLRAGSFLSLGILARKRGDLMEAQRLYGECLEITKRHGDQLIVAHTLNNLGILAEQQGNLTEAQRLYFESLEFNRKLGNQSSIAVTLQNLGTLAQEQGEYESARQRYAECLEINQKLGDQSGIALTLHNLGIIGGRQGEYETARQRFAESLEINQKLGNQSGIALTLHQLGMIAQDQGDYENARARYAEGLEIEKKLGHQSGIASTLHQLGKLAQEQRDYGTARQLYSESLEITKKLGDQSGIAGTLHNLGMLAEIAGDKTEAEHLFHQALEIWERLKSPDAKLARRSLERVTNNSNRKGRKGKKK